MKLMKILLLVSAADPNASLDAIIAAGASAEGYDVTEFGVKDEVGACLYFKLRKQ